MGIGPYFDAFMPDELDLDGTIINPVEDRIKNLSSKVRTTSEERDAARAAEETAKAAQASAEKERDFYASFAESSPKHPGSAEYRDAIKEKVMAGYSVEDAMVSVLNAEGKLVPAPTPVVEIAPAAGGSAPNQLPDVGTKTIQEMTREERRNTLIELEKRGDISLT